MTKNEAKVNLAELKKLYDESPSAKAILDHLASRERNRRSMPIDRLLRRLDGEGLSRGDLIRVFRRLEEIHCGRFVAGRRGHQSRFKWDVGCVDVGRAAAGETVKIEAAPSNEADEPADDLQEHRFRLRPDLIVSMELPSDLTATEAARLAAFVRTLPFEPPKGFNFGDLSGYSAAEPREA
jgi:hypothetical protein